MGFFDDIKDKTEDAKDEIGDKANDIENKAHEKMGEMKGRHDQAEADKQAEDDDDAYEPEEKQV